MRTGDAGISLIKKFEGLRLEAYFCPANIPTIGYGRTAGVRIGDRITAKRADEMLREDLVKFETELSRILGVTKVNANQFDALISFTYNLGANQVRNSTLIRKLKDGDVLGASAEFPKWRRGGGRILPGLVRRREAERKLFDTPVVRIA